MKDEEYSSLRAEIIGEQSSVTNLLIAMYTIFIAITTFAIDKQKPFLFIPAIFISILFKLQLLWKKTGVIRMAAYIIVNYEKKCDEMNWESDLLLEEKHRNKFLKKWYRIISVSSSKATTFIIGFGYIMSLIFIYQSKQVLIISILEIILGALGVGISLYIDIVEASVDMKQVFIQQFKELDAYKIK